MDGSSIEFYIFFCDVIVINPSSPHVLEVGNSYFPIARAFRNSTYSQVKWSMLGIWISSNLIFDHRL
jgi:hypothetical protein